MLARVIRSGVVEATHDGAVAVVAPDGRLVASHGDVDRRFYIRSAAKPFQALAARSAGAVFTPEQIAVICASHGAQPIHLAYVSSILAGVGLDESALQCPPAWPIARSARDRLVRAGHASPRRLWHNCSGKHAGMLAACVAAGWPTETYLDPDHPLQERISDELSAALHTDIANPGVDGCGAPVYEISTRDLARGFATDRRYDAIRVAMQRLGSLTAASERFSAPSRHWDVAAKVGAEGCFGLAVRGRFGVALKSFDGSERPLGPAMLDVMTQLGVAPALMQDGYRHSFDVAIRGGGEVVGHVESMVRLS